MNAVLSPERADPVSAQHMASAGLRAFARIAQAWGLNVEEQLALLGQPRSAPGSTGQN